MLFFSRRGEESFDLRQPAATLLLSWSQDMRSTVSFIAQWAAAALALLIAPYYSIRTWASVVDPDIWWRYPSNFNRHAVLLLNAYDFALCCRSNSLPVVAEGPRQKIEGATGV